MRMVLGCGTTRVSILSQFSSKFPLPQTPTTTIMLWSQVDIKFTTFTFLGLVTGIIYNIYNTKTIQWQAMGEVVAIATEPGPKCYLFAITFSFLHH